MTATVLKEIEVAAPRREWPRYENYSPTGLSWLTKAPSHWPVKRMRYAVRFPMKSEVRALPLDTSVSFAPMEAVGEYGGMSLDQVRPLEDVLDGYTYFRNGDVLVAKITPCFENGKGALARGLENGIGFGTTELHVLRAGPKLVPQYLLYLTFGEHFRKLGEAEMYGAGGQKRVPERFIQNLRHPLPPLDEQRSIAAFLDHETTKIDELIAKKRRLIELLKEKRQAVIGRVITKGLNIDAPRKPSGIDCLGDIPTSWEIKRLRHISPRLSVGLVINPSTYVDDSGTVPFFFGADVTDYELHPANARRITEESNAHLKASKLQANDVVTVRVGAPGVSAVVPIELAGANCASIMITRAAKTFDSNWLCHVFNSAWGRYQVYRVAYGAAQKQFNIAHAVNFQFPVPPHDEQVAISAALDYEFQLCDKMSDRVVNAIKKLSEYRSMLITAAVTGQIDVRNYRKEAPCP